MQLMEDSQEDHSYEIISLVHCELAEWLQNELAMSFRVTSQWVSCELKFFNGIELCGIIAALSVFYEANKRENIFQLRLHIGNPCQRVYFI